MNDDLFDSEDRISFVKLAMFLLQKNIGVELINYNHSYLANSIIINEDIITIRFDTFKKVIEIKKDEFQDCFNEHPLNLTGNVSFTYKVISQFGSHTVMLGVYKKKHISYREIMNKS